MLKIYFLGKVRVEYQGIDITERFGKKTIALLCLLVLNRNKYISREKMITYLWPDSSEETAKYNLRYNLWIIKKNIGFSDEEEAFLYVDKDHCALNDNYVFFCDVVEIMNFRWGKKDTIEKLLMLRTLCAGDFLEGYYFSHCNDFNEIIILERTRFEAHRIRILRCLEELYEEEGELDACLDVLEEIMEIDPYDESAALRIISIYAKSGRRSMAVVWYNTFRNKIAGTLGIQPSENLRQKYEEIRENTVSVSEEAIHEQEAVSGKPMVPESHKEKVEIHTACIPNIQWFWVSDVVGKLFENDELKCSMALGTIQLLDLAFLRPDILNDVELEKQLKSEVSDVRIGNAFISLLNRVCSEWELTIHVKGQEEIDEASKNMMTYLRSNGPSSLILK